MKFTEVLTEENKTNPSLKDSDILSLASQIQANDFLKNEPSVPEDVVCDAIIEEQDGAQNPVPPIEKTNESCLSVLVLDPELKDTLNEVNRSIARVLSSQTNH